MRSFITYVHELSVGGEVARAASTPRPGKSSNMQSFFWESIESIKEFIDENSLNFPLLSDENKEVSESYGVLNNFGLANRITFIIDKEGNIAKIIRDVDVDTHADEVFEIASGLN